MRLKLESNQRKGICSATPKPLSHSAILWYIQESNLGNDADFQSTAITTQLIYHFFLPIYQRTLKQKTPNLLGPGFFNFEYYLLKLTYTIYRTIMQ